MMHEFHPELPGYDPEQIWHDGCEECEHRGRKPEDGMMHLDRGSFARAWDRSARWNRQATEDEVQPTLSDAERPLLTLLWRFQVALERNCGVPIGTLPGPAPAPTNPYDEDTPEHRAWRLGFLEADGSVGITYDGDPESPRSVAYDEGRTAWEEVNA